MKYKLDNEVVSYNINNENHTVIENFAIKICDIDDTIQIIDSCNDDKYQDVYISVVPGEFNKLFN